MIDLRKCKFMITRWNFSVKFSAYVLISRQSESSLSMFEGNQHGKALTIRMDPEKGITSLSGSVFAFPYYKGAPTVLES